MRKIFRYAWLPLVLALPVVLILSSTLTFRELREMKLVYLRNRAATIAARLETVVPHPATQQALEDLAADEPGLVDVHILDPENTQVQDPAAAAISSGNELFHIENLERDGEEIFRVYVPFHSENRLHVARIDLSPESADFLLIHARHNLLLTSLAGFLLVSLAVYALWSTSRKAVLERRQMELEHLAALGRMSAVLAHEIRNPLGTIKGFAQLAVEKVNPPVAALLRPVVDETVRLEKLVRDLLLYGRPPAPAVRNIDWEPLARELDVHARELVDSRRVLVTIEGGDYSFRSDPDLLKQVLLNLLRNAIEAASEVPDGQVRVSLREFNGDPLFAVEDNGPGIHASAREKLFEAFHTTKPFGTGLGLSVAKKLVDSLGGRITLGQGEGGGIRAQILFPGVGFTKAQIWKQSS